MSLISDYRLARQNVMNAFFMCPLEARCWLQDNTGVRHTGRGYNTRVEAYDDRTRDLLRKLAGPHGVTIAKMIRARK